ncbi:MAG: 50S ribosomal protein L29 [Deltaproteobacteria bacterium RIFOXYD12_FULL_56_24]|nr:MAG: 50S ribosomal protein L29 [Deltaproteobacteria bacterium RIFOXYD12_FULL_56_24]
MKMKDIRELGKDALLVKVRELSEEHFRMKFQHGIRPLENTAKLRQLRKEIARMQTALTEHTS